MAQLTPDVTGWMVNITGQTGFNNIPSNVQHVKYSDDYVYISCTCIPGYDIGPWGNPGSPVNQNFIFRITRAPQQNTGTATVTPGGHIGVFVNGVSIFNATSADSYNNLRIWHNDAKVVEGHTFDHCLGHPAPNGEYHNHVTPNCLYDELDSLHHSPLIGFAFDGFPLYGGYGYADPQNPGTIKRMVPGYRQRSIAQRHTRPDGNALQASEYGPDISTQYPLGYFIEDNEFVQGLGDLDEHNGRFCKTPEYPNGTYAYFVTIDRTGAPIYPYTLGFTYYGVVGTDNVGPQSGHVTVPGGVIEYTPVTPISPAKSVGCKVGPNPASTTLSVRMDNYTGAIRTSLMDLSGRTLQSTYTWGTDASIPLTTFPAGTYQMQVELEGGVKFRKTVVRQ